MLEFRISKGEAEAIILALQWLDWALFPYRNRSCTGLTVCQSLALANHKCTGIRSQRCVSQIIQIFGEHARLHSCEWDWFVIWPICFQGRFGMTLQPTGTPDVSIAPFSPSTWQPLPRANRAPAKPLPRAFGLLMLHCLEIATHLHDPYSKKVRDNHACALACH